MTLCISARAPQSAVGPIQSHDHCAVVLGMHGSKPPVQRALLRADRRQVKAFPTVRSAESFPKGWRSCCRILAPKSRAVARAAAAHQDAVVLRFQVRPSVLLVGKNSGPRCVRCLNEVRSSRVSMGHVEERISSSMPRRRCSQKRVGEEMDRDNENWASRWLLYVLSTPAGPVGPHALTDSVQLTASPAKVGHSRSSCGTFPRRNRGRMPNSSPARMLHTVYR